MLIDICTIRDMDLEPYRLPLCDSHQSQSSKGASKCFGVPLDEYFAARPHLTVPIVVQKCVDEVERRGIDVQGIYRMAGGKAVMEVWAGVILPLFSFLQQHGRPHRFFLITFTVLLDALAVVFIHCVSTCL